jgi:hypothetical protein
MRQSLILALLVFSVTATPSFAQLQTLQQQRATAQMKHQRWVAARRAANQKEQARQYAAQKQHAAPTPTVQQQDQARAAAALLLLGVAVAVMSNSDGAAPSSTPTVDTAERQRGINRDYWLDRARKEAEAGNADAAQRALEYSKNP